MSKIDRHEVRASIQLLSTDAPADYEELSVVLTEFGKIKIDRNVAPAVEATLYVVSPADLEAWDPRQFYRRVQITTLQRFGDVANFVEDLTALFGGDTAAEVTTAWGGLTAGDITDLPGRYYSPTTLVPTSRTFDLVLRRVNHRLDGITELTLRSDEILLIDRLYMRTDPASATRVEGGNADELAITFGLTPKSFAEWLLALVGRVISPVSAMWQRPIAPGAEDIPITVLADEWLSTSKAAEIAANSGVPIGSNGWDMVRDFAGSLGLRVYSDGNRGLIVDTIDESTGREVTLDKDLNLLDFEFTIDLDAPGFGAKVAARYPATTPGDPDEFYVEIPNPPGTAQIWAGPGITIDRAGTAIVDQGGIKGGPTYSVLTGSRAARLAIQAPVTAINQYTALPGDTVTIIAPSVDLTGEVDAVEFEIGGTWQMTITATNLEVTP